MTRTGLSTIDPLQPGPYVLHTVRQNHTDTIDLDIVNGAKRDATFLLEVSGRALALKVKKFTALHLGPFTLTGPATIVVSPGKNSKGLTFLGSVDTIVRR